MSALAVAAAGIRVALCLAGGAFLAASCREPTSPYGPVRVRWYQPQQGQTQARPAVVGDRVIAGSGHGDVIARHPRSGAVRWIVNAGPEPISGANLVVKGDVVVAVAARYAVALDVPTGRQRWRYEAPVDTAGGRPAAPGLQWKTSIDADNATVFVPAWGASVGAIDLATGAVRWTWQPGRVAGDTATSGVFRSGAEGVRVSGDTVYVTGWHYLDATGQRSEAWLAALDKVTGRQLWRVAIPSYSGYVTLVGAPVVYRDLVIFTGVGGRLWAVDRFQQNVVWQFPPRTQMATLVGVALYGDVVYHDGGDAKLYALRASDGAVLWTAHPGNGATRNLLVTERRVYYTMFDRLHVLDRRSGTPVAVVRARPSGDIFETPAAFADGRVYVILSQGALCFDEP